MTVRSDGGGGNGRRNNRSCGVDGDLDDDRTCLFQQIDRMGKVWTTWGFQISKEERIFRKGMPQGAG